MTLTISRKLHYGQKRLIFDRAYSNHVLPAGIRYGKSYLGPPWHFKRVRDNPRCHFSLVNAPTFRLLKLVNLTLYVRYLQSIGLIKGRDYYVNRSSDQLSIIFPATKNRVEHTVLFISGDNPDAIIGFTASHSWSDECSVQDEEVKRNIIQRVSDPLVSVPRQKLWTSVPKGTGNWFYEAFGDHKATRIKDSPYSEGKNILVLHGSTFDNPYLDQQYRDEIAAEFSWDEAYYRNYILGEWVNLSTNAFYFKFNDRKNVDDVPLDVQNNNLILTFDFNVGQMSWSVIQKQFSSKRVKGIYAVVKSNRANGRNIQEACQQFIDLMPPDKFRNFNIEVFGDPSGYSRSTHSWDDGYNIIMGFLKPYYPLIKLKAPRGMPTVSERSYCTNRCFAEERLIIDRSCTKVIESAKMAESDGKGGIKKPKGKEGDTITHPMEAIDMALVALEPAPVSGSVKGYNRFG